MSCRGYSCKEVATWPERQSLQGHRRHHIHSGFDQTPCACPIDAPYCHMERELDELTHTPTSPPLSTCFHQDTRHLDFTDRRVSTLHYMFGLACVHVYTVYVLEYVTPFLPFYTQSVPSPRPLRRGFKRMNGASPWRIAPTIRFCSILRLHGTAAWVRVSGRRRRVITLITFFKHVCRSSVVHEACETELAVFVTANR